MEAKELMKGNLVYDETQRVCKLLWFNHREIQLKTEFSLVKEVKNRNCSTADFYKAILKPIPLTKEWAEKNATTINDSVKYYFNSSSGFMPCIMFNDNDVAYWIINKVTIVFLPYIHTWQNLFFALTKEELKI